MRVRLYHLLMLAMVTACLGHLAVRWKSNRSSSRPCRWPQPGKRLGKRAISAAYKCCLPSEPGADMPVPKLVSDQQWHSNKPRQRKSVTAVTQLSMERLFMLGNLCSLWPDPVAAVVYVPTASSLIVSTNATFDGRGMDAAASTCSAFFKRMEAEGSCTLDLELATEDLASREEALLYPFNAARNRALMLAQTEVLLLVDADFMPSPTLVPQYRKQKGYAALLERLNRPAAIVLPAFEAGPEVENKRSLAKEAAQRGKKFAVKEYQRGELVAFHVGLKWKAGHKATDYERWVEATEPYKVNHTTGYEPYVMVSRKFCPWYDERFRGYGWDKIQHLDHLAGLGVEFWVHPSAYVVHHPHSKAATYNSTLLSGQRDKLRELFSEVHTQIRRRRFAPVVSFPEQCGANWQPQSWVDIRHSPNQM